MKSGKRYAITSIDARKAGSADFVSPKLVASAAEAILETLVAKGRPAVFILSSYNRSGQCLQAGSSTSKPNQEAERIRCISSLLAHAQSSRNTCKTNIQDRWTKLTTAKYAKTLLRKAFNALRRAVKRECTITARRHTLLDTGIRGHALRAKSELDRVYLWVCELILYSQTMGGKPFSYCRTGS